MAKLTLDTVTGGYDLSVINNNFDKIETAMENTLSRDGTAPNTLEDDLDVNGNRLYNIASLSVGSLSVGGQTVVPGDVNITGIEERENYAAIRAYTGTEVTFYVKGHTLPLDGGAGVFRYDASDTTSADNGGTILVDAAGRRWKREFSGPINLAWFALGNGSDESAALQKAFDLGGSITGPNVEYVVSQTLLVKSNTDLRSPASFKLANGANTDVFKNVNYGTGSNSNISLRGITIDGNVANQTNNGSYNKMGIKFRDTSGVTIEEVEFKDCGTDCLNLINCSNVHVRYNELYGSYNSAIVFENTHDVQIYNNYIHDCGSKTDAFVFTSSGHAVIGVNVACNNVIVSNNFVSDMGDSCLRNESAGEGWVISDNLVVRSGKDSIKIMGKTIGGTRFITVANPTNFTVSDTISAGGGSTATGTVTAVNGSVLTVTMGGISSTYHSFRLGDAVTSTPGGGNSIITKIESEMAKANVVSNNVIIDAGNNGIVANGDMPTIITGNVVKGTGKNTAGAGAGKWFASASGISVTDNSSDFQISDNVVSESYASGVTMENAYRVTVRGNRVTNNGTNGFDFNQCDGLTVEGNEAYDNGTQLTNTYAGIRFASTGSMAASYSRHSVRFNRSYNTGGTGQRWGIRAEQGSGTVSNSVVQFNDLFNNLSAAQLFTNWSGSGNSVNSNTGYKTENTGTATIPSGSTLVSVTHGLNITPDVKNIKVSPTNSMGSASKFWIGSVSSTTFQINVNADPGATTATFSWSIW